MPVWIKIAWTALAALVVPVNWKAYGVANFLWFSDLALLLAVPALWLESPLLASVIALAALIGLLLHRTRPHLMTTGHGDAVDGPAPLVPDDTLHHEPPSARRASTIQISSAKVSATCTKTGSKTI